jgi:hypothetical protein
LQNAAAQLSFDIPRISRHRCISILPRTVKLALFIKIQPAAARARFGQIAVGADRLIVIVRRAFKIVQALLRTRPPSQRESRARLVTERAIERGDRFRELTAANLDLPQDLISLARLIELNRPPRRRLCRIKLPAREQDARTSDKRRRVLAIQSIADP